MKKCSDFWNFSNQIGVDFLKWYPDTQPWILINKKPAFIKGVEKNQQDRERQDLVSPFPVFLALSNSRVLGAPDCPEMEGYILL